MSIKMPIKAILERQAKYLFCWFSSYKYLLLYMIYIVLFAFAFFM